MFINVKLLMEKVNFPFDKDHTVDFLNKIPVKDRIELISECLSITQACALLGKINEKRGVSASSRLGVYPIEDEAAFHRVAKMDSQQWEASEISFTEDIDDFNSLPEYQQDPLLKVFGFFAVGDGSVTETLVFQMLPMCSTVESRLFYISQLYNEKTHAVTYSKMIFTLVRDQTKRDEILNSVETNKEIGALNDFIQNIFLQPKKEGEIYFMLAAAEYAMFMPLFAVIFWYRNYTPTKLKNIKKANEMIAKDEAFHAVNGAEIYKTLSIDQKYTTEQAHACVDKIVKLMDDFTDSFLKDSKLETLTDENMRTFNRFVTDDFLQLVGHKKMYNVENPFPWMTLMMIGHKANFYEATVSEYSKINPSSVVEEALMLSGNAPIETEKKQGFALDEDF